MTLQDLMLQTFRIVGEPSDLSPYVRDPITGTKTFSNATAGSGLLVSLLNRAYERLGMFKDNEGKIIKFRHLNLVTYFQPVDITGLVLTSTSAAAQITISPRDFRNPPLYREYDNCLAGWCIQVNGEVRLIVKNATRAELTLTLDKGFSTADSLMPGAAYSIFTRVVPLVNSTDFAWYDPGQAITEVQAHRIISITKITNITNNDQFLWMPPRDFRLFEYPKNQAKPTLYMITGRGVEFNYAPLSGDIFKIEYYGAPEMLAVDIDTTTCLQVPSVPYAWHEVIWMMAAWMRLQEDKNYEEASLLERNMNALVRQLVEEGEHNWDYQNSQTVITDWNYQ